MTPKKTTLKCLEKKQLSALCDYIGRSVNYAGTLTVNLSIIKITILDANFIAKPLCMPHSYVNFSAQLTAVVPDNDLLSFQGQTCETQNNMLRK